MGMDKENFEDMETEIEKLENVEMGVENLVFEN